jgi:hypothetical protein
MIRIFECVQPMQLEMQSNEDAASFSSWYDVIFLRFGGDFGKCEANGVNPGQKPSRPRSLRRPVIAAPARTVRAPPAGSARPLCAHSPGITDSAVSFHHRWRSSWARHRDHLKSDRRYIHWHRFQTGSGGQSVSHPTRTGGSFPGPRRW